MFSYSSFLDFIIRLFLSSFREFARFPLVITTTWKSVYKPSIHKAFPQYTYIIMRIEFLQFFSHSFSNLLMKKTKNIFVHIVICVQVDHIVS